MYVFLYQTILGRNYVDMLLCTHKFVSSTVDIQNKLGFWPMFPFSRPSLNILIS